jgi:hypothetical protein
MGFTGVSCFIIRSIDEEWRTWETYHTKVSEVIISYTTFYSSYEWTTADFTRKGRYSLCCNLGQEKVDILSVVI